MLSKIITNIKLNVPWSLTFIALRYRNFRLVFAGSVTEHVGEFMEIAGLLWLVNELTHSPLMLTIVGSCRYMTLIFLPPFGGVIADRIDRRRLLMGSLLLSASLSLILIIMYLTKHINIPALISISLLQGVATSFNHPARQSIVPNLVHREHLLNATSLDTLSVHASRAIGTPIAGYILSMSIWPVFALRALGCLLAIGWLLAAQIPATPAQARRESPWRNFCQGFLYVKSNIHFIILIALFTIPYMVQNTYMNFLPVVCTDILHVDSVLYGWLQGITGIGALICLIILGMLSRYKNKFHILIVTGALLGMAVIGFSVSVSVWMSLVFLLFMGGMMVTFSAVDTTLLQSIVSDEMRGRVLSLREVLYGIGPTFSIFFGMIAQYTGVVWAMTLLGFLCAAVSISLIPLAHRFREIG